MRDSGTWRPPRGSDRGRGLVMMRGLMETVDVSHTDEGTVVVLERTLQETSDMSPLARVIDEHVDTVAVAAIDGEIDSSNVAEIGRRVRETLTNQSMALVVDLALTSYLDSAGHQPALRARRRAPQAPAAPPPLRPGGVADRAHARDHRHRVRDAGARHRATPPLRRRRARRVAAADGYGVTVTVFVMNGWIRQMSEYVPGAEKVTFVLAGSGLAVSTSRMPLL